MHGHAIDNHVGFQFDKSILIAGAHRTEIRPDEINHFIRRTWQLNHFAQYITVFQRAFDQRINSGIPVRLYLLFDVRIPRSICSLVGYSGSHLPLKSVLQFFFGDFDYEFHGYPLQ